jgi:hypothetical protein
MRIRLALWATAVALATLPAEPSIAAPFSGDGPGGGQIVVTPGDNGGRYAPPSVDTTVQAPGAAGGSSGTAAAAGGGPVCRYQRAADWERWARQIPAGSRSAGVSASRLGDGRDHIDPHLHLYARTCKGVLDYVWVADAGASTAAALPTPEELAREAFGRLVLPLPVPRRSPDLRLRDGSLAVVVGEHTWVWVDAAGFVAQRRRVAAGPVWAEVVATPVGLRVDPGDGSAVVACRGAGTAFDPARYGPHAASPTCDHVYARSSFGLPGERVTARFEVVWRVGWTGFTGAAAAGGVLPDLLSRATAAFAVAEAQALVTSG